MILYFQCKDLSKVLLVSKFETNWPNIKFIIAFHLALSGLKRLRTIKLLNKLPDVVIFARTRRNRSTGSSCCRGSNQR